MLVFAVNQPFPQPIPPQDGLVYAYQPGIHALLVFMSGLKEREVQAARTATIEFALTPWRGKPSVLFLQAFIPGLLAWGDAPFHLQAQPPDTRPSLDQLSDEQRLSISVVLVDRRTRLVRAIRHGSLSPQFSRALHGILRQQIEEQFDQRAYDTALAQAYKAFPDPAAMVRSSIVRCTAGS